MERKTFSWAAIREGDDAICEVVGNVRIRMEEGS